jgi:hypothetical protein
MTPPVMQESVAGGRRRAARATGADHEAAVRSLGSSDRRGLCAVAAHLLDVGLQLLDGPVGKLAREFIGLDARVATGDRLLRSAIVTSRPGDGKRACHRHHCDAEVRQASSPVQVHETSPGLTLTPVAGSSAHYDKTVGRSELD